VPFHPALIDLCAQAVEETAGQSHRLPSGPLHDAAEVARSGFGFTRAGRSAHCDKATVPRLR
jgi:hypothetical protein